MWTESGVPTAPCSQSNSHDNRATDESLSCSFKTLLQSPLYGAPSIPVILQAHVSPFDNARAFFAPAQMSSSHVGVEAKSLRLSLTRRLPGGQPEMILTLRSGQISRRSSARRTDVRQLRTR